MNGSDDLVPGVVVPALMEDNVGVPDGVADGVFAPELGGHGVLFPHGEALVLYVHSEHGRVVGDLVTVGRGSGG